MSRLDIERQNELEPQRLEYAIKKIEELGYEVIVREEGKRIEFMYKNNRICFWPYSGWASGKGIKDGRGIDNILKQLQ